MGSGRGDGQHLRFRSEMSVELIKYSAADSDVVWAARVSTAASNRPASFQKDPERSRGLINYLMRDRHGSPFEHSSMTFLITAPIFVFREFHRHRAGWSYNEESGRYRELDPVFYLPGADRKLVQQGRPGQYEFVHGTAEQHRLVDDTVRAACHHSYALYQDMLSNGNRTRGRAGRAAGRALLLHVCDLQRPLSHAFPVPADHPRPGHGALVPATGDRDGR